MNNNRYSVEYYISSSLEQKMMNERKCYNILNNHSLLYTKKNTRGINVTSLNVLFQTELVGHILNQRAHHKLEIPSKYVHILRDSGDMNMTIDEEDKYYKFLIISLVNAETDDDRISYYNKNKQLIRDKAVEISEYGIDRMIDNIISQIENVKDIFQPTLKLIGESDTEDYVRSFMGKLGYYKDEEYQFNLMVKQQNERVNIPIPGIRCSNPNCKSTNIYLDIAQVRAKDEGMTLFVNCKDCNNVVTI